MNLLSVVVPCYNEQENIPLFYEKLCEVAAGLSARVNIEVIFVDDGSSDNTLEAIKHLTKKNNEPLPAAKPGEITPELRAAASIGREAGGSGGSPVKIRYLSFSRNFGKEAAMYAGLRAAKGTYAAVMDVDLQDPPEMLADMLFGIEEEGYDCVATRRVTRKGEPPVRSFFARMFYRLINKISKTEIVDGARDFRLMTRQMIDAILEVEEYNRFSKGIFGWVGFRTKWLAYENTPRKAGSSKWSFGKLFLYSLDGILAFSTAPLAFASLLGILMCILAIIWMLVIVIKTLIFSDPVAGYPSMISIILLIGGVQLFCIGILGQYLSKTYLETKKRPLYILRESSDNFEEYDYPDRS